MANRVAAPNLFAPANPNWSLALLDQNAQNVTGAINDSSLGAANGPLNDTGGVNAYVVTCSYGTPSAYNNGMTVFFTPGNTNTGASTLTVSPLSSLPIVSASGSALTGGELQAGSTVGVVCDGSAFRIVSQPISPQFGAMRLRSFNAVGNPSFEVDQRNAGVSLTNPVAGTFVQDRWRVGRTASTMAINTQRVGIDPTLVVPGTNFQISANYLWNQLTTQQATLAATDHWDYVQTIEGATLRELIRDVTSLSILASCSVPLKFGVTIRDVNPSTTKSLAVLCQITTINTWTLFTFPNLPLFASGGNWNVTPGIEGAEIRICLAAGTSQQVPANGSWQSGNFTGAAGQDNFAAQAVNSVFRLGFVQWEPGSQCTTLIDKPFSQNLDECLRYFSKSYDYDVAIGAITGGGGITGVGATPANTAVPIPARFPKLMAKVPNVTLYNHSTGAANSVYNSTSGVSAAVTNAGPGGKAGIGYFVLSAAPAAGGYFYTYHYTADTGW